MMEDLKNSSIASEILQCEFFTNTTPTLEEPFCRSRFDSWSCWPDTPAGHTASHSCPEFIDGFDKNRFAYLKCEEDGRWFIHPDSNRTWANYTQCVDYEDYTFRQNIILMYTVGYCISLVTLSVSLFIFTYFKSLRCARITIHMNLFGAFAMNNLLWIVWYICIINSTEVLLNNPWWCILIHILLYFFLLSTYSWMLCEGLYLHTVLITAFVSESRLVRYMLLLGWGIPTITSIIYSLTRSFYGTTLADTEQCWMDDCSFTRIIKIPVAIAILTLNALFLFNILRVLLVKLRNGAGNSGGLGASRASLQAFRAAVLLVPLLGLNYLLIPFRPDPNHPWEYVYEIVSALTSSLQGLCVSIFFCFCNGEVITQIKRRWATVNFIKENSLTATTSSGPANQFIRSNHAATGEKV